MQSGRVHAGPGAGDGDARLRELSVSLPGGREIHNASAFAPEPDVAVITNIGTAHIGRLGSRAAAIAQAKCEITDRLKPSGRLNC